MPDQQQQLAALQQEVAHLRREVRQQRQRRHPRRGRFVLIGCIALLAALAPLGLLAGSSQPFADVDPNSVHYTNIIAIRQAGITNGCNPAANLYCPNNNVTRQEMASFLARTAGIGGNPPVVNAAYLDGFLPNDFARVQGVNSAGNVYTLTNTYQPLVTGQIVTPGPGLVLIDGTITVYSGASSYVSAFAYVRLRDVITGEISAPQGVDIGTYAGDTFMASVSPSWVFAVGPGSRTFVLEGYMSGSGPIQAQNAHLTALYVPFGPTGGIASGLEAPQEPAPLPHK